MTPSELKVWLKGFLEGKGSRALTQEDIVKIEKNIDGTQFPKNIEGSEVFKPKPAPAIPWQPFKPYPDTPTGWLSRGPY